MYITENEKLNPCSLQVVMGTTPKLKEKEKKKKKESQSSESSSSSPASLAMVRPPEQARKEKKTPSSEPRDRKPASSPGSGQEEDDDRRSDRDRHRSRRRSSSRDPRSRTFKRDKTSAEEEEVTLVEKSRGKDLRKPAEPEVGPKKESDRAAKDRCPICWQAVSRFASGRDQHMYTNATCLAWQIYQSMRKKDWKLAVQQGKALKEHRAREAEKSRGSSAHLVSKETRDAASKAQAAAAEWLRKSSSRPEGLRVDRSRSRTKAEKTAKTKKSRRRPPSPSPSPSPQPPRKQRRRSPSESSSAPRRKGHGDGRQRQIIINVQ